MFSKKSIAPRASSDRIVPSEEEFNLKILEAVSYKTQRIAESVGNKISGGLVKITAHKKDATSEWVPIALLRPDQYWLTDSLRERGLLCKTI